MATGGGKENCAHTLAAPEGCCVMGWEGRAAWRISGVFPGQAEAVCLHFQCNGKVAELGPFLKGHSNLKRNGPMLILRL